MADYHHIDESCNTEEELVEQAYEAVVERKIKPYDAVCEAFDEASIFNRDEFKEVLRQVWDKIKKKSYNSMSDTIEVYKPKKG